MINSNYLVKAEEIDKAFEDQCTPANPKLPLVSELEEVYLKAFDGVGIKKNSSESEAERSA